MCGITVNSRCAKSYERAEQLRCLLASLRHELEGHAPCGEKALEDCLQAAFAPSEEGPSTCEMHPDDLQTLQEEAWTFRVLVDVRAWAGRLLTSRSFGSIGEALSLRRRVQAARLGGWDELRATWAECMSRRSVSTDSPALSSMKHRLAGLDASHARAVERRSEAKIVRKQRAAERRALLQDRRRRSVERRLLRLLPRLERKVATLGWKVRGRTMSFGSVVKEPKSPDRQTKGHPIVSAGGALPCESLDLAAAMRRITATCYSTTA